MGKHEVPVAQFRPKMDALSLAEKNEGKTEHTSRSIARELSTMVGVGATNRWEVLLSQLCCPRQALFAGW